MPWSAPCCDEKESKLRSRTTATEREQWRQANTLKRLYNSAAWRNRTVPFVLARDPLCVLALTCNGTAPSTDVDHKIRAQQYIAKHESDETFFFEPENLQGACHACHSRKSQLENKGLWLQQNYKGDMGLNL